MHGCIISTVATDALVLKHQSISIHSADQISIALDQFQIKYSIHRKQHLWNEITFEKKNTQLFKG